MSAKKSWKEQMKFSGTLIEELMATVERAERRAHTNELLFAEALPDEPLFAMSKSVAIEPWIASMHEYPDFDTNSFDTNFFDPNLVGVT